MVMRRFCTGFLSDEHNGIPICFTHVPLCKMCIFLAEGAARTHLMHAIDLCCLYRMVCDVRLSAIKHQTDVMRLSLK